MASFVKAFRLKDELVAYGCSGRSVCDMVMPYKARQCVIANMLELAILDDDWNVYHRITARYPSSINSNSISTVRVMDRVSFHHRTAAIA